MLPSGNHTLLLTARNFFIDCLGGARNKLEPWESPIRGAGILLLWTYFVKKLFVMSGKTSAGKPRLARLLEAVDFQYRLRFLRNRRKLLQHFLTKSLIVLTVLTVVCSELLSVELSRDSNAKPWG